MSTLLSRRTPKLLLLLICTKENATADHTRVICRKESEKTINKTKLINNVSKFRNISLKIITDFMYRLMLRYLDKTDALVDNPKDFQTFSPHQQPFPIQPHSDIALLEGMH